MDKYQILALMTREENQLDADPFALAASLAQELGMLSERLKEEELLRLIRIGGAIYRIGVEKFGTAVEMEDLFPACDNWPYGPHPHRSGFRR